jgi:4-amino-4-deoxy-L-arabinose transferase-like glycosyltransferase
VLTKGPAALVLAALTWALFWLLGADGARLWQRLRPLPGLALSLALSAPWFALALWREGQPYWESFFGYHNLQRYTRVVNNHQQGWWYFIAVLLVASLPFTPLLLWSLRRVLLQARTPLPPSDSLGRFAASWLLAVLLFFSLSATKLPSYWLVALPAAALLVALARPASKTGQAKEQRRMGWDGHGLALASSMALLLALSVGLAASQAWLIHIHDPTLPGLRNALAGSAALPLGAALPLLAGLMLAGVIFRHRAWRLAGSQAILLLVVPLVVLPVWRIGDELRGAPVRAMAAKAVEERTAGESLAMVGLRQPSLHFYSRATVLFEGRSARALVNVADRLRQEERPGLRPSTSERQPTLLLVIDNATASRPHWQGWKGQTLARAGVYQLWRLDRRWLEARALQLAHTGTHPNWRDPRPERF